MTNSNNIPTYEKIETVVLSYLQCGITEGAYGSLSIHGNRIFSVDTDGYRFSVFTTPEGWCVCSGDMYAVEPDLLEAARNVVLW